MVRVGLDTFPRRMTGFPATRLSLAVVMSASAGGISGAPCAPLRHSGKVTCPGGGSQAGFCATREAEPLARIATISRRWYMMASSQPHTPLARRGYSGSRGCCFPSGAGAIRLFLSYPRGPMAFFLPDHDDHSPVKPPQQDSHNRQNHRPQAAQKPNADFRDAVDLLLQHGEGARVAELRVLVSQIGRES